MGFRRQGVVLLPVPMRLATQPQLQDLVLSCAWPCGAGMRLLAISLRLSGQRFFSRRSNARVFLKGWVTEVVGKDGRFNAATHPARNKGKV